MTNIVPHGGELIDRRDFSIDEKDVDYDRCIEINKRQVKHVLNIANGVYSPLEGFMDKNQIATVLESMRVNTVNSNDVVWSIPIFLNIHKLDYDGIGVGDRVMLMNSEGNMFAYIDVEDVYTIGKSWISSRLYGTDDNEHDGVLHLESGVGHEGRFCCLGGKITQIEDLRGDRNGIYEYYLEPKETRLLFKEKGFDTVVGFQTRNVPHLGHEYIQKTALKFVDGIFINPITGHKKMGDFRDDVILSAYNELMDSYYLSDRAVLSILESPMFYAGPKEAVHHAIMRKNFGCSHFIVGRDHAGVGDYYEPYEAQELLRTIPDLGINIVEFKEFAYCEKCGNVVDCNICPHDDERVFISGSSVRSYMKNGNIPPNHIMRDEVAKKILSYDEIFV